MRKLLDDDRGSAVGDFGDLEEKMVVMLLDLPADGGVRGVVVMVHTLLLRVLLPVDDEVEELLVLELIFLSLLNAPMLLMGGLEATTMGA